MKRITFITGHYGSGKSEFSVNLAIAKHIDYLIDLDIVNPYFRSREAEEILEINNIKMISSGLKNALGSDLPFISGEVFHPFRDKSKTAIFDLGGDLIGARLVRQFSDFIDFTETDLLLCTNVYREKTSSVQGIIQMIQSIEGSSGLRVTGLINNSNFLRDTTIDDVLKGQQIILEVSKLLKLPIIYTSIYEKVDIKNSQLVGEILPLKLYLRKNWL
jgi:hypothetical protein